LAPQNRAFSAIFKHYSHGLFSALSDGANLEENRRTPSTRSHRRLENGGDKAKDPEWKLGVLNSLQETTMQKCSTTTCASQPPTKRSFVTSNVRAALPHLRNGELRVWLDYRSRANGDDLAWPSDRTVAKDTGQSFRTVRKAKRRLIELGLLEPTLQARRAGRYWIKPFRVVEPAPSMFSDRDPAVGHSAVADGQSRPTDDHLEPRADDHFQPQADDHFGTPHQGRYQKQECSQEQSDAPRREDPPKHEAGSGTDAPIAQFVVWWEQRFARKYGFSPNVQMAEVALLKRHLKRGESVDDLEAAAEAYLASDEKWIEGHPVTMLLGTFYDRYKSRARANQNRGRYSELEVGLGR
jgi:hypothetical protein